MMYCQLLKLYPLSYRIKNGLMNKMSAKIRSFPYENYKQFLEKLNQPVQNLNYKIKQDFNNQKMNNYLKIIHEVVSNYN